MEQINEILKQVTPTEGNYLQELLSSPIKRLAQFSDVELTQEEICAALTQAKATKHAQITMEKNQDERRRQSDILMKPFTPADFLKYCDGYYLHRFNRKFILDGYNKPLIEKLCQYFTMDPDFENNEFSHNKGLLIMGNVGVGKTELMRFMQKNKKCCFKIASCIDIADEFVYLDKDETIEKIYSTPLDKALHDPSVFFQRKIGYCFDDLGTEEIKNNYGNKKNVMADIIMAIYQKKDFSKYHITTNLNPEEIEQRYGTRVKSRLREMFNVFVLTGEDRRV
jgi:DNA replication protein DnaC